MVKYCLGFLYYCGEVLLIKKLKPEWQAGLLNGIGGKVKDDESPQESMYREFKEETSLDLNIKWKERGLIIGTDYEVCLYSCDYEDFVERDFYGAAIFNRGEFNIDSVEGKINFYTINKLSKYDSIDNLAILVPTLYFDNGFKHVLDYTRTTHPQVYSYKGN